MAASLHIYKDPDTLNQQCAARIIQLAQETLKKQEHFHIALAGGTTPRALYQQLSQMRKKDFPHWERIRFYFGDERSVPPEHDDSNYRMALESLFQPLSIKEEAVQRMRGELEPEAVIAHYGDVLEQLPKENGFPRFDLVLLGMGADGHIASLFPGTSLLEEREKPVGASWVDKLECWRYSLTLPILNNARHIILLVSGHQKADVVRHVVHGVSAAEPLPVEMLNDDKVEWYMDAEAAHFLDEECEA